MSSAALFARSSLSNQVRLRLALEQLETRWVLSHSGMNVPDMQPPALISNARPEHLAAATSLADALDVGEIQQSAASLLGLEITDVRLLGEDRIRIDGVVAGEVFRTVTTLNAILHPPAEGEDCGILSLELGEIHLDVLGLNLDTSQICLEVTAEPGAGNLLGNLLCDVSGLLDGPTSLGDLTGLVRRRDLRDAQDQIEAVVQEALNGLFDATPALSLPGETAEGVCPILDLSLGPIDLNVLGLNVALDDCEGGPVTVALTAVEGPGNLLGNLLCGVVGLLDGLDLPLAALPETGALPIDIRDVDIRDGEVLISGLLGGLPFETTTTLDGLLQLPSGADECGILSLELGPIHLDLLGLNLDTSEICLDVTAESGENRLLGNLLCNVTGLLDAPASLTDILSGLGGLINRGQTRALTRQIERLLESALDGLFDSPALVSAPIAPSQVAGECSILDLSLGPVNLDLLGLVVNLDNCEAGPVTVNLTAVEGPGNLLGNLLCGLTGLLDGGLPVDPAAHDAAIAELA